MKKRDIWLLAAVAALIAIVVSVYFIFFAPRNEAPSQEPADVSLIEQAGLELADSYMCIWQGDSGQILPLTETYAGQRLKITQNEGEYENVVELGVNSMKMYSSNCPDQMCVQEGEVTLENRLTRVLASFIICRPHNELTLELITQAELVDILKAQQEVLQDVLSSTQQ